MTPRTSSCGPVKMCAVDALASEPSGAEVTAVSEASFLRVCIAASDAPPKFPHTMLPMRIRSSIWIKSEPRWSGREPTRTICTAPTWGLRSGKTPLRHFLYSFPKFLQNHCKLSFARFVNVQSCFPSFFSTCLLRMLAIYKFNALCSNVTNLSL